MNDVQQMERIAKWVEQAIAKAIQQAGNANLQSARAWNLVVGTYQESKQVVVVDNCFAYMFTNIGDTIAEVNGMVIFPNATPATGLGDSRTVGAHLLDLFKGNITLKFRGIGAAPNVEIVQLHYLEANTHPRK